MKIEGVKGAPVERVVLDRFFDRPAHVDVRVISPYGRALVKEIMMESFELGELDAKGRASEVKANPKGAAEREIRVRDVKLRHSFVGTDIMADGVPAAWDKPLWDALDEADPRILESVIETIDRISKTEVGEDTDPT
ncbi:MAG: hypothetical protein PHD37_17200 [Gallionellaceae bacterium]|nr:hypothetical protein [Gallionellaceae bacterium]